MKHAYLTWRRGLRLAAALLALASAAQAQTPFVPGSFVVQGLDYTGLSGTDAAPAVVLLNYAFDGQLLGTHPLPTADAPPNLAFADAPGQVLGGNLTRSQDGRYLVLLGYHAAPGTTGLSASAAATVNRLVARVDAAGQANTTSRISDAFQQGLLRGAASADGSAFYALGFTDGVRYLPLGNAGPTTEVLQGNIDNPRSVQVAGGSVLLAVSNRDQLGLGLAQLGAGLPTTAGQALTLLPGFGAATELSTYNFVLTDQSAAVPGYDVAYLSNDYFGFEGQVVKYSLVGGRWQLNGALHMASAPNLRTLAGQVSGGGVQLLAGNTTDLFAGFDNAGYNAPPSSATLQAVATAPAHVAFRGIALAPLAAPLPTQAATALVALGISPNPTAGELLVQLPGGTVAGRAYALHDLAGRQVAASLLPASGCLSLAGVAAGTYLLRVAGASPCRVCKTE